MTYTAGIAVRYRDLDPRGHVNHAVYVSYLEEAKAGFFADVLGVQLDETSTVIRSLELEYSGSIEFDSAVTIDLWIDSIGETSFTIEYKVIANGRPVASGRTVSVYLDPGTGAATRVPDDWRAELRHWTQ